MSYRNKDELLEIVNKLGIKLELIPPDYPKPIPNKKYSFQEYKKFKSEIKDFPEYEQPFYININNIPVSCWIENGEIDFKFSGAKDGNLYEVTELDFVNCRNFEDLIKK